MHLMKLSFGVAEGKAWMYLFWAGGFYYVISHIMPDHHFQHNVILPYMAVIHSHCSSVRPISGIVCLSLVGRFCGSSCGEDGGFMYTYL